MEMACFWLRCHSLYWIGFHFSFWWCERKKPQRNTPVAASHLHGTKPPCWRAKVALGQDKQRKLPFKFINVCSLLFVFNRPFPSSKESHFQSEANISAKPLLWKWVLIMMQIQLIFTTKVSHLASFWKRDFLELRNGLLSHCDFCSPTRRFCTKWMASCKLKGLFTEVSIYLQVFQI